MLVHLAHEGTLRQINAVGVDETAELVFFKGSIFRKGMLRARLGLPELVHNDSAEVLFSAAVQSFGAQVHCAVEGSYIAVFTLNGEVYAVRGVFDAPALYWVRGSAGQICISDEINIAIDALPRPLTIRASAIRHFLAFFSNLADSHPIDGLGSIAAGQGLKIDLSGGVTELTRNLPFSQVALSPRGTDSADWGDALELSLLENSRSGQSIGLLLSGGLDSGGIATVAAKLGLAVQAINMSIPSFPELDEWGFSDRLARSLAIPSYRVIVEDNCFDNITELVPSWHGFGINPFQHMIAATYQHAESLGVSMLWTGTGGDEIHPPRRNFLRDSLRHRQWSMAARFIMSPAARSIPHLYKTALNDLIGRRPRKIRMPVYMLDGGDHDCRYFQASSIVGENAFSQRQRVSIFQYEHTNARAFESEFLPTGIKERAHPYMHPALIELALTTPAYQSHSQAFDKLNMRRCLSTLSSDDFVWRSRVGLLTRYYQYGWGKNLPDIKAVLLDHNAAWPQFIERKQIEHEFAQKNGSDSMLLLNCLALELWLNRLKRENISFSIN